MASLSYVRHEVLSLKDHPDFTEAWLQDRIKDDPTILGLGDVEVRDIERRQPRAGRLDLLLHDAEADKRYEVEIQLGATDESHIIRCLEYWDIERKRYPQYDHCAVLIAEDVTARFLNVVSLFNGLIPLIAIKLVAARVGDQVVLIFVKVLDELVLGEDEEDDGLTVDRADWEQRASRESVALADECLGLLHGIAPNLELNYKRNYIGLKENGSPNNFVIFRPKKDFVRVEVRIAQPGDWADRLEAAGVVTLQGGRSAGSLRFRLAKGDPERHASMLRELFVASRGIAEE